MKKIFFAASLLVCSASFGVTAADSDDGLSLVRINFNPLSYRFMTHR